MWGRDEMGCGGLGACQGLVCRMRLAGREGTGLMRDRGGSPARFNASLALLPALLMLHSSLV